MTRWRSGAAALLGLAFALGVGAEFPHSDQHQYLLEGLRMADPGFLPGDWFTGEVAHHHHAFSYLVAALAWAGPMRWTSTAAHLAATWALAWGLWLLVSGIYERPLLTHALALLAVGTALAGRSVLGATFLAPALLPVNVAAALLVLGLALLVRGRPLAAGAALGASGLAHANFLFLVPLVVGPPLALGRMDVPVRQALAATALFLAISAPTAIGAARFVLEPRTAQDDLLMLALRGPHHYLPASWPLDRYLAFLALVAPGCIGLALRRPEDASRRRAAGLVLAAAGVLAVGLALTTAVYVPAVAALYPFRLAPYLVLASLVAAAGGAARLLGRWPRGAMASVATLLVALAARGMAHSGVLRPLPNPREALYAWVRTRTPPGALFVVPPGVQDFRLLGERPIVVDWKCFPLGAADAREWLRRVRRVSGLEAPGDLEEADRGYGTMDAHRARSLAEEFGADYLLARGEPVDGLEVVYRDPLHVLHRVR